MFFNWFVTNMCFYGLTSSASVLLDDIYINYTLVILGTDGPDICTFWISGRIPNIEIIQQFNLLCLTTKITLNKQIKINFLNFLYYSNKLVTIHTYYRFTDVQTNIYMDVWTKINTYKVVSSDNLGIKNAIACGKMMNMI